MALCKLIPWEALAVWNPSSSVLCLPSKRCVLPGTARTCLGFLYFLWTYNSLDRMTSGWSASDVLALQRFAVGIQVEGAVVPFDCNTRCWIQKSWAPAQGEHVSSTLSGLSQGRNPVLVWPGPCAGLTGTVPLLFRYEATHGDADSDIAQGDESVNCTDCHVCQIVEKGHPYLFSHLFPVAYFQAGCLILIFICRLFSSCYRGPAFPGTVLM